MNHKSVLTPQQKLNINDLDAINIVNDHEFYTYIDEENKKVYLYLSSNYQELFVFVEGNDVLLELPKKVEYRFEKNIEDEDDPSLLRLFTITVDLYSDYGNTDINFVEKSFPDLNKSYMLLIGDFSYRYDLQETHNYCYQLDSKGKVNETIMPVPIIIYICFEKGTFRKAWQAVQLRDRDENSDIKGFRYEFMDWQRGFPVFNIFQSIIKSPLLNVNRHYPVNSGNSGNSSRFTLDGGNIEPKVNIESIDKAKIDIPNEIRPPKVLPPPITDFKSLFDSNDKPQKSSLVDSPTDAKNKQTNYDPLRVEHTNNPFNVAHTTRFVLPGTKKSNK